MSLHFCSPLRRPSRRRNHRPRRNRCRGVRSLSDAGAEAGHLLQQCGWKPGRRRPGRPNTTMRWRFRTHRLRYRRSSRADRDPPPPGSCRTQHPGHHGPGLVRVRCRNTVIAAIADTVLIRNRFGSDWPSGSCRVRCRYRSLICSAEQAPLLGPAEHRAALTSEVDAARMHLHLHTYR